MWLRIFHFSRPLEANRNERSKVPFVLVSRACAAGIYGVILNRPDAKDAKRGVEQAATARRREELRAARRKGAVGPESPPPAPAAARFPRP